MSLDEVSRETMVGLEIEKAYSTMEDCELMASKDRWSGAAGRLYYAVFHAVCALLIHDGYPVKAHKGAGISFSQHYIHTSIMPAKYGELFFQLENLREKSDYDCFYKVWSEDVLSPYLLPKR